MTMKMLPIRQKQIVDKIISAGFSNIDFEFNELGEARFELYYKNQKNYNLKFSQTNNFISSPGENGKFYFRGSVTNWEQKLSVTEKWLSYLKENVEIGNPWDEIQNIKNEMEELNLSSYDKMLTKDERQIIENRLVQLYQHVEKLQVDTFTIKKDLDHLIDMSDKISKKDWVLLFIGNITGWFFSGLISKETTISIWQFAKELISIMNLKMLN